MNTHRTPLASWPRPLAAGVVLAYRRAMADGGLDPEAYRAAHAAFLAAGGDPERAPSEIPIIVSAAARDHSEWFWRPVRERIAREETWWKARGVWPPPKDRSRWPKAGGAG